MKAGSGSGARRNTEPQHHDEKLKLAAALGNQAFASLARSIAATHAPALRRVRAQADRRPRLDPRPRGRPAEARAQPRLRGHVRRHGRDGRRLVRVGAADARPGQDPGPGAGDARGGRVRPHGRDPRPQGQGGGLQRGRAQGGEGALLQARGRQLLALPQPARGRHVTDAAGAGRRDRERQADGRRGELPRQPPQRAHRGGAAGQAKRADRRALLLEAFSNHFLTDSFSSGHLRTPRQTLAEEWHAKVPMFFTNFKMFMAERIAKYINDHNSAARSRSTR